MTREQLLEVIQDNYKNIQALNDQGLVTQPEILLDVTEKLENQLYLMSE